MNVVPDEFIRVMPDALRGFISEAFQKAGTSEEDAAHMAHLPSSHGSARCVQSRYTPDTGLCRDDA